ncbi:MAG: DnaD domain protein [Bacilli bacterium]
MKTNNLINALKKGNIVIPSFLLSNYKALGLEDEEFILFLGLINEGDKFIYDVALLSEKINLNKSDILSLIERLSNKKLINIKVEKNNKGIMEEYLDLAPFYEKLSIMMIGEEKKEESSNGIYEKFEKEFGRTLSPMEYEIIGGWFSDNFAEEIILEGLKEASYNHVSNLRYIDKILYEWQKKGLDTVKKIQDYKKEYNKKQEVELFDYNWLEDDE